MCLHLCGGGKHIFDKDTITHSRVIDEDVGDGADEVSVLDNGGAMGAPPVADTATRASGSGRCAT